MGLIIIPLIFVVVFFGLLTFKGAKRTTELDKAVDELNDAKNEAKIHSIKKKTKQTLNSINDKGNENE